MLKASKAKKIYRLDARDRISHIVHGRGRSLGALWSLVEEKVKHKESQ